MMRVSQDSVTRQRTSEQQGVVTEAGHRFRGGPSREPHLRGQPSPRAHTGTPKSWPHSSRKILGWGKIIITRVISFNLVLYVTDRQIRE